MKIRVTFDWVTEVPDLAPDLDLAVREMLLKSQLRFFGEVMNELEIAAVEKLEPWEQQ